jgi:hypothetical protein
MPQTVCSATYLHVYDVESGLWHETKLGSLVSPVLVEAMNLLLSKDGILAFIGTRSEFGHYLSELKQETAKDFRHCWTSLPASTILGILGLSLNMPESGRPELVFYGSPLTLTLAFIMEDDKDPDAVNTKFLKRNIGNSGHCYLSVPMLEHLGVYTPRMVTATELQEAESYLA